MSIEEQLELLRYQIKLIRTVVASDEYPYFMFLLDHDFTEKQTRSLNDVLYILNRRLSEQTAERDEQLDIFHREKIEDIKRRNELFSVPDDYLLKGSAPTFEEFASLVKLIAPIDVNPLYLLKSLQMQGMYVTLCDHLLNTK
ncbi:DUF1878 family protein [Paenibacillus sp. NPDC056722]|uniref:DUF1878 family protein n=1 Tax=Paenibacillus sp. NPDC056722 TaxID=3345924 RepID=UPI00368A3CD3